MSGIKGIKWEMAVEEDQQGGVHKITFELRLPIAVSRDKAQEVMRSAMRRYLDGQLTDKENGSGH
jgi:hypothetical protein